MNFHQNYSLIGHTIFVLLSVIVAYVIRQLLIYVRDELSMGFHAVMEYFMLTSNVQIIITTK